LSEVIKKEILAVIFDFDDTLVPDSTTQLLKAHGIDTSKFWQHEVAPLIEEGYDPPAAWLNLLLKNVRPDKPLAKLTNAKLREFGSSLDRYFYPGLPGFFEDVRKAVAKFKNIDVEFYIISGGLWEIVRGSKIVQRYFRGIYGCHLGSDTPDGTLNLIKRSITFTEKTRYIFEIHKGLDPRETWKNPILVNKFVRADDRRIPLRNMIYVGDGLTDIPCFSLLKGSGGLGIGVFDPNSEKKTKEALEEFLQPDRVVSMHAPNYKKSRELGSILRAAVASRCAAIQLERAEPRRQPIG